jgi:hypothetical protein
MTEGTVDASSSQAFSSASSTSRPSFDTRMSFLPSNSSSLVMAYSSMGSTSKHLEAFLHEDLKERQVGDGSERFAGEVVDRLLDLRHGDVI